MQIGSGAPPAPLRIETYPNNSSVNAPAPLNLDLATRKYLSALNHWFGSSLGNFRLYDALSTSVLNKPRDDAPPQTSLVLKLTGDSVPPLPTDPLVCPKIKELVEVGNLNLSGGMTGQSKKLSAFFNATGARQVKLDNCIWPPGVDSKAFASHLLGESEATRLDVRLAPGSPAPEEHFAIENTNKQALHVHITKAPIPNRLFQSCVRKAIRLQSHVVAAHRTEHAIGGKKVHFAEQPSVRQLSSDTE